jgi:Uma2 family endonuclease
MSTAEKLITPDELAAMPDGERYELIHGRLVEREMSNITMHIGRAILFLLADYSRQKKAGETLNDGYSYRCFPHDPDQVRKPDVSWFSASRWSNSLLEAPHIELASNLVVEVVSPTDNLYNVTSRVKEFLTAGTQDAWIVHPNTREIERRFSDGRAQWYKADEVLDGAPMLSGLSFKLADILSAMP